MYFKALSFHYLQYYCEDEGVLQYESFLFLIFLDFIQENPIQSSKRDSDNLEFFRKSC